MTEIMFTCPVTGRRVSTGFESDHSTMAIDGMLVDGCDECGGVHVMDIDVRADDTYDVVLRSRPSAEGDGT